MIQSNNICIKSQSGAMKLKYLVPLLGFLVMATFLGIGLTLNPRHLPSTLINKTAPAFTLQQLHDENSQFSPSDYLGKRWLLNVWASWCVGCRVEHPLLNELAQRTNIPMVGLNYKDEPSEAKAWLAQRGNPYAVIAKDFVGDAAIDWGVYGAPETFIIDEKGLVIYKHTGPLTVTAVRDEILPLFEDAPQAGDASQPATGPAE